jgi:DNA-binding MarR family transcriptional regulator
MLQELPIGFRFSLLHRAFRRKLDEMLGEKELTGVQFGVLAALGRLEEEGREEISQRDLEQTARLSHANMTDILRRLEKKGFIRCEQSSRDRRFKCVSSTEKAIGLKDEVARVEKETFEWLTRGLSEAQIEELLAVTDVMLKNAWDDCGKGGEKSDD